MPYTTTDTVISKSRSIMPIHGIDLGTDTKIPEISGDLSFISVALDLAYAAYSLGYQKQEEAPRMWAERLLNLIIQAARSRDWHLAQSGASAK